MAKREGYYQFRVNKKKIEHADLFRWLDAHEQSGTDMSSLIRYALTEYLKASRGQQVNGSALGFASGLDESVQNDNFVTDRGSAPLANEPDASKPSASLEKESPFTAMKDKIHAVDDDLSGYAEVPEKQISEEEKQAHDILFNQLLSNADF